MDSLSVSALGRVAQLGVFYDVRSDTFLSGMNLFTSLSPESTTVIDCHHTDSKYVQGDAYDEKCHHLDVSAELKLSVLAGLFQLSGSGKYLNDRKSTSRVSSCTAMHSTKTVQEKISNLYDPSLRPLMCPDAVIAAVDHATHIVTEVHYGANVMITFESQVEDSTETSRAKGKLSADLQKATTISLSGHGEVNYQDSELKKLENLSFRVFGDILSDGDIPQTFQQALEYVKVLPTKVRAANRGRGVPLRYELTPISVVEKHLRLELGTEQVVKSIREATIHDFVLLFESVAKMKQELQHLHEVVKQFEFVIAHDDNTQLALLIGDLDRYEIQLRSELKSSIVTARKSQDESSLLEDLYQRFTSDARSPSSTRLSIEKLTKSVNEATSFAKHMTNEGATFIPSCDALDNLLLSSINRDIYVLITNTKHRNGNEGGWHKNLTFFVKLIRNAKSENAAQMFYVQDTSPLIGGDSLCPKMAVLRYRNGRRLPHYLSATENANDNELQLTSTVTVSFSLNKARNLSLLLVEPFVSLCIKIRDLVTLAEQNEEEVERLAQQQEDEDHKGDRDIPDFAFVSTMARHDMMKKIMETERNLEKLRLAVQKTRQMIIELMAERDQIADIIPKFTAFVKANTIAPYDDPLKNCLTHLIHQEAYRIESGAISRWLQGLQEMLRTYTEKVRLLDDAIRTTGDCASIINPMEIEDQLQILYNLPSQGKRIRRLVEIANVASKQN